MLELTVDKPLLRAEDILGEAPVWDSRRQKLYWVDIDGRRVHWYEPSSSRWSFSRFPYKVSAIACSELDDGLIAAIDNGFAFIPFDRLFGNTSEVVELEVIQTLALEAGEKRFNEGMADPAGRFLAGTMGLVHGTHDGQMYSLIRGAASLTPVLRGITCTNGMGWVDGGRTMYFTDSWDKCIDAFDYDLTTGEMTNRRRFSSDLPDAYGWPDGLCVDTQGGVWSARWGAGKVIRISPEGVVNVVIDFPQAWNMTSCVFGGSEMDVLYVTSARTDIEGDGPPGRLDGGSVFAVTNTGFKGEERFRYRP